MACGGCGGCGAGGGCSAGGGGTGRLHCIVATLSPAPVPPRPPSSRLLFVRTLRLNQGINLAAGASDTCIALSQGFHGCGPHHDEQARAHVTPNGSKGNKKMGQLARARAK